MRTVSELHTLSVPVMADRAKGGRWMNHCPENTSSEFLMVTVLNQVQHVDLVCAEWRHATWMSWCFYKITAGGSLTHGSETAIENRSSHPMHLLVRLKVHLLFQLDTGSVSHTRPRRPMAQKPRYYLQQDVLVAMRMCLQHCFWLALRSAKLTGTGHTLEAGLS